MTPRKLLARLQFSQQNVHFKDLLRLTVALGFVHDRTRGSHQVFIHPRRPSAQLNLQPDGKDAKPYQVKQLLGLMEEYDLSLRDEPSQ